MNLKYMILREPAVLVEFLALLLQKLERMLHSLPVVPTLMLCVITVSSFVISGIRRKNILRFMHYPWKNPVLFPLAPEVIFICVKEYSLDSVLPFIRQTAGPRTIIIPILNIYGTGARMQKELPDCTVLDGCIYVSASLEHPGVLVQHGPILRVVFGPRDPSYISPILSAIQSDLRESGIDGVLSTHIQRDALEKFSYVSPIGAAGVYLHAVAGDFQKEGAARELFKSMIREISALAAAMGYPFEKDYVKINLEILSNLSADATTSMQRDIMEGKPSELDGLVMEPLRLAKKYSVSMPCYEEVAKVLCPLEF